MSDKPPGAFVYAGMLGVIAIAFTLLFAMMAYMDQIIATMKLIPAIYYYGFYGLWVGGSFLAMTFGSGNIREVGTFGFVTILFAGGVTLAFTLPRYIAPVLKSILPAWPVWMWLGVGIGIGAVLLGVGFLGPPVLARLRRVENGG